MKKHAKKIIAMTLAVVMLVSLLSTAALAADEKNGQYYTVIGDSNASGYGLDAYFKNAGSTEAVKEGDLIDGSYPAILANALGIDKNNVSVRSHSGWRTNEFLYMLQGDACGVPHDNFFMRALDFVKPETLNGEGDRIREAIDAADIISVNFGSNDIYSYSFSETSGLLMNLVDHIPNPADIINDPATFFNKLIHTAEILGILPEIVSTFKSALDRNTASYKANMPKVIDAIRAENKDAKIIVLGVFCPVSFDLRINHQVVLDFKSSSDKRVKSVNDFLRNMCKEKGCTFVDISQTECFGLPALDFSKLITFDENIKYSAVKMMHPTDAGHAYIAKQIVNVIKNETSAFAVTASYSNLLKRSTLKWNKVDGAGSYRIYRSTSENGSYSLIGTSLNTTFIDLLTLRGHTYYYKVVPVVRGITSANAGYSIPVSIVAK